jgi:hypothetical protein
MTPLRGASTPEACEGRFQRPFPEGSQPRSFETGVQSASTAITLEAVSTAFFATPVGVYAGETDRLLFDG